MVQSFHVEKAHKKGWDMLFQNMHIDGMRQEDMKIFLEEIEAYMWHPGAKL